MNGSQKKFKVVTSFFLFSVVISIYREAVREKPRRKLIIPLIAWDMCELKWIKNNQSPRFKNKKIIKARKLVDSAFSFNSIARRQARARRYKRDTRQSNYRKTGDMRRQEKRGAAVQRSRLERRSTSCCDATTRRVSQTTTLRFRAPAPLMDICITVRPQMLQLWNNEIVRSAEVRHPPPPSSLSAPFSPFAALRRVGANWRQLLAR